MEEYPRAIFDPITGLCVVAKKEACPLGYRCVDKTYDQQTDADLWKDSFLTKKERYLCMTRFFPLDQGRLNNVLESIAVLTEKDNIPSGFSVVDSTYDTKEKAMKKKLLAVKMVPRFSVQEAICEIIVLSGMKRAPAGFTVFGDIGGLLLCFRKGPVPPAAVKSVSPSPGAYMLQQKDLQSPAGKPPARPPGASDSSRRTSDTTLTDSKRSSVGAQTGASLARQMSRTLRIGAGSSAATYRTIEDVPFRTSCLNASSTANPIDLSLPIITILSPDEIRRQFDYDFSQEKAYLASTDDIRTEFLSQES